MDDYFVSLLRAGLRPEEAMRLAQASQPSPPSTSLEKVKAKEKAKQEELRKYREALHRQAERLSQMTTYLNMTTYIPPGVTGGSTTSNKTTWPSGAGQVQVSSSAGGAGGIYGPPHGSGCTCAGCVRVFGHPGTGRFLQVPPSGAPQLETAASDVEVARYGLRTFAVEAGTLKSLFQPTAWDKGVIEARCMRGDEWSPWYDHSIPHERCTCGVYATVDLQSLIAQYRDRCRSNVAVVAVEGTTIIGDKGMRTSAARVVAYWTPDSKRGQKAQMVYERVCGDDVPHYDDMNTMLKDFNFRAYPFPWPDREEHVDEYGYSYTVSGTIRAAPRRMQPMVTPSISPEAWRALKKMLEGTGTDKGVDAVRHALGVLGSVPDDPPKK